jgi:cytochrome b
MDNHHTFAATPTRVWDLPIRIFHWALAVCVFCLLITGFRGGDAMAWHYRFGYCVLTLLLFRLVWGIVGGKWSRFTTFIYAPSNILRYLKGQGDPLHSVGHNPLGAFSVFAMLALLLVQVSTGLISDDEISAAGHLTKFVSNATVSLASSYHVTIGKVLLIVLVITHLAAIVFYLYKKRENLIKPMLHGDKLLLNNTPASVDTAATRTLALIILLVCAAFVYWLVSLGG